MESRTLWSEAGGGRSVTITSAIQRPLKPMNSRRLLSIWRESVAIQVKMSSWIRVSTIVSLWKISPSTASASIRKTLSQQDSLGRPWASAFPLWMTGWDNLSILRGGSRTRINGNFFEINVSSNNLIGANLTSINNICSTDVLSWSKAQMRFQLLLEKLLLTQCTQRLNFSITSSSWEKCLWRSTERT